MTLTDDEVRAIDEAARVLRRVRESELAASPGSSCCSVLFGIGDSAELSTLGDTRCMVAIVRADGTANSVTQPVETMSPGEALRRLVGR
jgi:hypothetical protein